MQVKVNSHELKQYVSQSVFWLNLYSAAGFVVFYFFKLIKWGGALRDDTKADKINCNGCKLFEMSCLIYSQHFTCHWKLLVIYVIIYSHYIYVIIKN